jgi:hypothetical protein
MGRDERGQGTVEWVGTLLCVSLLLLGLVAAGVRAPGAELARGIASRILCAASIADGCGDEPVLIAEYGTEVGKLIREHMPTIVFEQGSRAVPVDFRRCRSTSCGDAATDGLVHRTDERLPVTAFVHVVDCRAGEAEASEADGADCSGPRAGNLYLEYFTYYADSATLRDLPVVGEGGFHFDDWEGTEVRIGPDGLVSQRASSHNGYNAGRSVANWGSDAGLDSVRSFAEAVDAREGNGWGPETRLLFVSGGSHAGNTAAVEGSNRFIPGRRVHLIPLEPIATSDESTFAIVPPWQKHLWRDPEATGTD